MNFTDLFAPAEIKWKAQVVRGNRAMAVAFIDARLVEDRLDAVVGIENWQDSYALLPSGNVICTLKVKINGEWIEKSDVGSQSDQPDEGDRVKSAFSDALKRAAVKYGIGRYLYRIPQQWVDYDPQTKQLKVTPKLPASAIPENGQPSKPLPAKTQEPTKPAPAQQAPAQANNGHTQPVPERLLAAASRGIEALREAYKALSQDERATVKNIDDLKKKAEQTDLWQRPWKEWFAKEPSLQNWNESWKKQTDQRIRDLMFEHGSNLGMKLDEQTQTWS